MGWAHSLSVLNACASSHDGNSISSNSGADATRAEHFELPAILECTDMVSVPKRLEGVTTAYDGSLQVQQRRRCVRLPSRSPVVQVAAGEMHSCALDAAGSVWTWGAAWQPRAAPAGGASGSDGFGGGCGGAEVPSDLRCVMGPHAAAVDVADGNKGGGVGASAEERAREGRRAGALAAVAPLVPVRQVACGARHSLAVDLLGGVWAWGWNGYGQCGRPAPAAGGGAGGAAEVATPARLQCGALGGVPCVGVAAGLGHSLALTEAGQVAAWGWNGAGQCGPDDHEGCDAGASAGTGAPRRGARSFSAQPRLVVLRRGPARRLGGAGGARLPCRGTDGPEPGGSVGEAPDADDEEEDDEEEVCKISCGGRHSLALAAGGRLYGWGSGSAGQLDRAGGWLAREGANADDGCAVPQLLLPAAPNDAAFTDAVKRPPCRVFALNEWPWALMHGGGAGGGAGGSAGGGAGGGATEARLMGAPQAAERPSGVAGGAGVCASGGPQGSGSASAGFGSMAGTRGQHLVELVGAEAEAALALLASGALVIAEAEGGWSHTIVRCVSSACTSVRALAA